ncbi:expressed unknown protein [Seminavis robusta]|uniref:Uncharacterized protein n=1 Tax=Seminavis robusta TaxID=568900 RepID=A0A9N8HCV7_9STRA|nr:expressed unknown protein [Seminavis robusta]|eukprot:Sro397_g134530.1 n/a (106) ;mRNA; f:57087-57497
METNHDHELPLLQGQANGASNNTNATNTNNSVDEDGLMGSELGSELDLVIGAVVDSGEKKKENQLDSSTHYGRLFNQEYHDNTDFQNDFFPMVIDCSWLNSLGSQ